MQTFLHLLLGFPDVLDKRGVITINSLAKTSKSREILQNVLKWARVCCVNHEYNRQVGLPLKYGSFEMLIIGPSCKLFKC